MIIDEYVFVKPNNHSIMHYINKGYDAKCRKELLIKVDDLTPSSRVKVNCKCEKCGNIKSIRYQDYYKCLKLNNIYLCSNCKFEKTKITNNERYGKDDSFNMEKTIRTMNIKYGCNYSLQNKEIKNKKENTCVERYGYKNASENYDIKNKVKQTNIRIFLDMDKKQSILNKRKETCIEKYGVDNYSKTEEYKLKSESTCMKKYGYKHNGSVPELIKKRLESRNIINSQERSLFFLYKKDVNKISRRFSKKLLEEWNGYDYYDGELIINNFLLKKNSRLYPSIDHKIPIYYGFVNNIKPEIIGEIDNLCITKKYINSRKKNMIYEPKLLIKIKLKIVDDIIK